MTTELVEKKADPLRSLVEKMKPEIKRALPALGVTIERLSRVFITCVRKTPKLAQCNEQSLAAALMQCAELGLEPGSALGHVWLIPYKDECTTIIGYRGLVELMRRSGEIKSMSVNVVYEKDKFEYKLGLHEDLIHEPAKLSISERGEITHAYFTAHFMYGGFHLEVMDSGEIDQIRNGSQGKNQKPWKDHYAEMAKKTVLRRASKLMPTKVVPVAALGLLQQEDIIDVEIAKENNPVLLASQAAIKKAESDKNNMSDVETSTKSHDSQEPPNFNDFSPDRIRDRQGGK